MSTIIVSDVHLGGRYCRVERFLAFLDRLPPDAALILNGDTVDAWRYPFCDPRMMTALERLRAEGRCREVTWIRGNNDAGFELPDPGPIRFVPDALLPAGIYVTHGDRFDCVMHNLLFSMPFRLLYKLRILLGGSPMDVATYVKTRWGWLYGMLAGHVVRRVTAHARVRGYATIVCGHLHRAEDRVVGGVRYLNTGSWTEPGERYVSVEGGNARLLAVGGDDSAVATPSRGALPEPEDHGSMRLPTRSGRMDRVGATGWPGGVGPSGQRGSPTGAFSARARRSSTPCRVSVACGETSSTRNL